MEWPVLLRDHIPEQLPDHARYGLELLEPDQIQRARDRRPRSDAPDAQRPVHALRRAGVPGGLSGRWRHRAVRQRHRRFSAGALHWLRLLRQRLPVQHSEIQPAGAQSFQVHALRGPRQPGPGAGLHQVVPHDAKNPGAYGGLPANPTVPWTVKLWKAPLKWLGNLAIIGGAVGLFVHYLRYGPKIVDEGDSSSRGGKS